MAENQEDSIQETGNFGNTELHFAAIYGKEEELRKLLELPNKRCLIDIENACGRTVFFEAVARGCQNQAVTDLKNAGANINCQETTTQDTALHVALRNGSKRLVDLLLSFKPNPNIQNAKGNTCLHEAILTNDFDFVKNVCEIGAKLNIKNKDGDTPRGMKKPHQICKYLRELNKKNKDEKTRKRKRKESKTDNSNPKLQMLDMSLSPIEAQCSISSPASVASTSTPFESMADTQTQADIGLHTLADVAATSPQTPKETYQPEDINFRGHAEAQVITRENVFVTRCNDVLTEEFPQAPQDLLLTSSNQSQSQASDTHMQNNLAELTGKLVTALIRSGQMSFYEVLARLSSNNK